MQENRSSDLIFLQLCPKVRESEVKYIDRRDNIGLWKKIVHKIDFILELINFKGKPLFVKNEQENSNSSHISR